LTIILKNNKDSDLLQKFTLLQKKNIENPLAQITRQMLLFQEILKFAAVNKADQILMTLKIRLILLLSFHKKVGLKTICFTGEKIEFFFRFFFLIFTAILDLIKLRYI
jgi:hypothetical protein